MSLSVSSFPPPSPPLESVLGLLPITRFSLSPCRNRRRDARKQHEDQGQARLSTPENQPGGRPCPLATSATPRQRYAPRWPDTEEQSQQWPFLPGRYRAPVFFSGFAFPTPTKLSSPSDTSLSSQGSNITRCAYCGTRSRGTSLACSTWLYTAHVSVAFCPREVAGSRGEAPQALAALCSYFCLSVSCSRRSLLSLSLSLFLSLQ